MQTIGDGRCLGRSPLMFSFQSNFDAPPTDSSVVEEIGTVVAPHVRGGTPLFCALYNFTTSWPIFVTFLLLESAENL